MAADRARLTYTPSRHYREVVSQQGRVTLEADLNEASRLGSEALRTETIDMVGPVGTPDDGYAVTATANGIELGIGQGTMYVGGLRLTLPNDLLHSAQPDWQDRATDPLWLRQEQIGTQAALVLLAQEQEIVATEDPALREPALGGPDSAARTRILQRFPLIATTATTCSTAVKEVTASFAALGRDLDPLSATLVPRSRLRVTALGTAPAASPCDPPAQTGYLGADNQLVRVQITGFDPATRQGRLLWGWNNASTLYRCAPKDALTLRLATRPIAPEFTPASGQAVQVLMPAADLGEGAIAAALGGEVMTLTAAYQPDQQLVSFPVALPAPYLTPPAGMPLFLRVWQEDLPFTLDSPVALTGTGLAVTISSASGGVVGVNDYWSFAVRPFTPTLVYPERLLTTPQPPDGPRQFLCPLAVFNRAGRQWQRADDCRPKFDSLVELTARQPGNAQGCCVTVGPKQAADLQGIIDKLAATGQVGAALHFEPGVYELRTPLVIDRRHRGLVLANCTGGRVELRASERALERFDHGMVLISEAAEVTLRGLVVTIPVAPPDETLRRVPPEQADQFKLGIEGIAIGIQVAGPPPGTVQDPRSAPRVTIEECDFTFPTAPRRFGVGILGRNLLPTLRIRGCRFVAANDQGQTTPLMSGVVIGPAFDPRRKNLVAAQAPAVTLSDNAFSGLSFGALIAGDLGEVRASGNEVADCFCGLALITLPAVFEQWDQLAKLPLGQDPNNPGFTVAQTQNSSFATNVRVVQTVQLAALVAPLGDVTPTGRAVQGATTRIEISANHLATTGGPANNLAGFADAAGPALYLWNAIRRQPVFATITANTCQSQSNGLATMMVFLVDQLAITGNLITNTAADSPDRFGRLALLVVPGKTMPSRSRDVAQLNLFAVSGNTMLGRSNLDFWPRKEWEARLKAANLPIVAWDFFNTEA